MKKRRTNDRDTLRELGLVDERATLDDIEKGLEEFLFEARYRLVVARERLLEVFPGGVKLVRAVGLDPNGGTGVTRLEEECINLEQIISLMESFLAEMRQVRGGNGDEVPN